MMPGLACCIVKSVECTIIYCVSYIRISLRRPEKNCEKFYVFVDALSFELVVGLLELVGI